MMNDRIMLKLAGERVEFLYNPAKGEVYDPLFPGIPIDRYVLACGHVLKHNELAHIIQDKAPTEYERKQLTEAINNFNDYGLS